MFTPPSTWHFAESDSLPTHVRTMVIGKALKHFPPSMNLSSESFAGTLQQYLKIVKKMNSEQGYEWKDLGAIQTKSGQASLSQVDTQTQWGTIRLMHTILLKNKTIYILTASALKDEFSIFYKDFFQAMRSLKIINDLYEMIPKEEAKKIQQATSHLKDQWQERFDQEQKKYPAHSSQMIGEEIFKNEDFQNAVWKPFQNILNETQGQPNPEWQRLFLQKLKNQLMIEFTNTL